MRNPNYFDNFFLERQIEEISQRYNKGMNPHEIAQEMNISEIFVKELFEDWRHTERANQDAQFAREQ